MTTSSDRPHVDGTVLPFAPTPSGSVAGRTMQESVYSPQPAEKRLPDDAPNILIVLIDDAGPALPEVFGGEIHTPTLERLTREGLGYNRFHTTAMFADAGVSFDGSQSSPCRQRTGRGAGQ